MPINKNQIFQILKKSDFLPKHSPRIQMLQGGISAFSYKIIYEGTIGYESKSYLLRCFENSPEKLGIVSKEFALSKIIREKGTKNFKVPTYHEQIETDKYLCIIAEFIEAENLGQMDDLSGYLNAMVGALTELHNLEITAKELPPLEKIESVVGRILKEMEEFIPKEIYKLIRRTDYTAISASSDKPVLLHGDIWPGNFMIDNHNQIYIIDLEDIFLGDPLYDIANFRLELLWEISKGEVEEFTGEIIERNKLNAKHLHYWDLLSLAKLSNFETWSGLGKQRLAEMRKIYNEHLENVLEQF